MHQRQHHAREFREARYLLGLTHVQCAQLLRVSVRTVQNWESCRSQIPHAAYKLLRILSSGKYLGHQWRDFHVSGGVLVTPEGHQFPAADLSWWSLCVRQAEAYRQMRRAQRGAPPEPPGALASSMLAQVRSAPSNLPARQARSEVLKPAGDPPQCWPKLERVRQAAAPRGSAKQTLSTSAVRGERGELSLTPQYRPHQASSNLPSRLPVALGAL
ncbi:VC1465 family Xer recombination activation factor [Xanthomonas translucens]|uniref:VC1465 family Xer recombination activation factor n=1 Tax=Xanthomonas campestris pv. translucens TaxID=343 RepID=UPI00272B7DFE|nr:VC1465 family Xer recombination activation factor [Xanthomonas translucens]WLA10716.1 VC1465 family Xer recombination activation factor [Xanthomonas translucens]